ncbi:MAG: copper homeostasis protein CutC [Planctomycetota bacterium]
MAAGGCGQILVELCVGGIQDAELAARQKVPRIELNSGMALGGLTPSAGLVREAMAVYPGRIIGMVRPREGGFMYSERELRQMFRDAEWMLGEGLAGLAVGFLDPSGHVDQRLCHQFRALCGRAEFVFHKAFDCTVDLRVSLETLADCGVDRVLTSGGAATAMAGALTLRGLCEQSRGRVQVLAGGGIRGSNVVQVLRQSGCTELHAGVREIMDADAVPGLLHFGLPGHGPRSYGQASSGALRELLEGVLRLETDSAGLEGT